MEGTIDIEVNGETFKYEKNDTAIIPTYAQAKLVGTGSKRAYVIQVDDMPTQIKLDFFESWDEKQG